MENLVYRTFIFELLCLHVKYLVMLHFRYNYSLYWGVTQCNRLDAWQCSVIENIDWRCPRWGYWYMGCQFRNQLESIDRIFMILPSDLT